jgi:hypothetical protein
MFVETCARARVHYRHKILIKKWDITHTHTQLYVNLQDIIYMTANTLALNTQSGVILSQRKELHASH